jgi:hypothetical protein
MPVEALVRLERQQASKAAAAVDPFPGFESAADGEDKSPLTKDLARLEHDAAMLGRAVNALPEMRIASRRFYLLRCGLAGCGLGRRVCVAPLAGTLT